MDQSLQSLVEELAAVLKRGVAIDDAHMRLLAHGPHGATALDAVRRESILTRSVSAEAKEWAFSTGVRETVGAVRVPGNPALSAVSRVGAAARCQGVLLAFIWVIDPDETLESHEFTLIAEAAATAGRILYQERFLGSLARAREHELLRDLLSPQSAVRSKAVAGFREEGLCNAGEAAVLVVELTGGSRDESSSLGAAAERLRRHSNSGEILSLERSDHGVVLAALKGNGRSDLGGVAARLHSYASEATGGDDAVRVGIGERMALAEAHESYRQAREALRIAAVVPPSRNVVSWDDLGVYQPLWALSGDQLPAGAIAPGFHQLIEDPAHEDLVLTLETFLDCAGDVKATAEAIVLHRASVYYRLQRIEEVTGMSLKDGQDRLWLHMSIKLARLRGLYGSAYVSNPPEPAT